MGLRQSLLSLLPLLPLPLGGRSSLEEEEEEEKGNKDEEGYVTKMNGPEAWLVSSYKGFQIHLGTRQGWILCFIIWYCR